MVWVLYCNVHGMYGEIATHANETSQCHFWESIPTVNWLDVPPFPFPLLDPQRVWHGFCRIDYNHYSA